MSALVSEIHIFADCHLRNQRQLLMNDDNTQLFGIFDIGKLTDLTVVNNVPLICPVGVNPAQNVHQG